MTFRYWRLFIPSGERSEGSAKFSSELEFLRELARWNEQQPGYWQYGRRLT